ncbi:MAG: type I-C CRISPR-associated protein Cas8c/Csd1 [Planctomycetota bacterium]
MLLQRLAEFHDRIQDELIPRHHKLREIDWIIELTEQGQFKGFIPTQSDEGNFELAVPYLRRSGKSPPPYLLIDTPAYVLGLGLDKMSEEKAAPRHEMFCELSRECAQATDNPIVHAVVTFLTDHLDEALEECPQDISASDLIGFSVNGVGPVELGEVQEFWQDKMDKKAANKSKRSGHCIICGETQRPIARRHPVELTVGPDRVQLITANESAFESYGLKASEIAPVCVICAELYGRALRYLFDSDHHKMRIASTTHVYWTREPEEFNPWNLLEEAQLEDIKELFRAAFRSKGVPEVDANRFYVLSVSTNTSRLVVRKWRETTVQQVRRNLANYFDMQRIVGPDGADSYFPLRTLALSLGRDFDSVPVQAEDALLDCAVDGKPLPNQVLHQAIKRARADADYRITRPRAALMRLVFESRRSHGLIGKEYPMTPELNTENQDPAYLCGRLLAVMESIQRSAIGATSTVVDRYFGTASSAPATVFGKLMRGAQNHLSKLRKKDKGAYVALDRQLREICEKLDEFPRTLSLQEQAVFSLGYYQQKAADARGASENANKDESE